MSYILWIIFNDAGRDAPPTLGMEVAGLVGHPPHNRVGWASCPTNKTVKKLKHINLEGYAYFITTNAYQRQKIFSNPKIADLVLSAIFFLKEKGYYRIYSFVIMPEHLHLIILP